MMTLVSGPEMGPEMGPEIVIEQKWTAPMCDTMTTVWRAAESAEVAGSLTWLRTELAGYWPRRESSVAVIRCLASIEIAYWRDDAAARVVAGAVANDHVQPRGFPGSNQEEDF